MKTTLVLGATLLVLSCLAFSQDSPRAEVYVGYSYLNIDTNDLSPRQKANGWEASVSGNFNKWFAVEGAVAGYYKNYSINLQSLNLGTLNVKVTDYAFAGGPRINLKPIFIHALFGGDRLTGSAMGFSGSQSGMAGLTGGGVQFKVSGPWSVRASGDYVFTRHNIFGGSSVTQNNFRAGVGLVYSFGQARETRTETAHRQTKNAPDTSARAIELPPAETRSSDEKPALAPRQAQITHESEPSAAAPPQPHLNRSASRFGLPVSALGVVVSTRKNGGAEIRNVVSGSIGAFAGLQSGDVINSIDGKTVRTPMELAAEFTDRKAGEKITIGYLVAGWWQTETVVILPAN